MLDSNLPRCPPFSGYLRILHVHIDSFRIFSNSKTISCTANNPKFAVFSEYAERIKNMQKEMFTFNNAWDFKGTVF
jgi:hypothetical protein